MAGDRRDWELRSIGGEWSTITSSSGFSAGLHYHELKISSMPSKAMMFGLLFPPDDAALTVGSLTSHLGRAGSEESLLGKHSLGFHFNSRHLKRHADGGVQGDSFLPEMAGEWTEEHRSIMCNHLGSQQSTPVLCRRMNAAGLVPADLLVSREGVRIGLLLDLVKLEYRMFYFAADNLSQVPTSEHLLATLQRGRRYFPAFSLLQAGTVIQLTTQARPPESQQRYLDTMAQLAARQREYRVRLHEMESRNQTLEQAYVDLRSRYEQLHAILTGVGLA